jgi:hypothetical protein
VAVPEFMLSVAVCCPSARPHQALDLKPRIRAYTMAESVKSSSRSSVKIEHRLLAAWLLQKELNVPETMDAKVMELNMKRVHQIVLGLVENPSKIARLEVCLNGSDAVTSRKRRSDVDLDDTPRFDETKATLLEIMGACVSNIVPGLRCHVIRLQPLQRMVADRDEPESNVYV